MSWLFWIVLAGGVLYFAFRGGKRASLADSVWNALLAEHVLGHIELVPDNPVAKKLADALAEVWRNSGFPNITTKAVRDSFNGHTRFEQLNLVAMAMDRIGIKPMLDGEHWRSVSNPFMPLSDNEDLIPYVAGQVRSKHGVSVRLGDTPLSIHEWGLADGPAPTPKREPRQPSVETPGLGIGGGDFQLAPSMPDITKNEPIAAFSAGQYFIMLVADVPTLVESRMGMKQPLQYKFVLAAVDMSTRSPRAFITLEHGITDSMHLCAFDSKGTHLNYGDGARYSSRSAFQEEAMGLLCDMLAIRRADVSELSKR